MRKATLGIGVGAALIIAMFVGRIITGELAGNTWPIRPMKINFRDMPKELGNWTAIESGDLVPEVFEALGAKDAEERTYQDKYGNRINYHGSVFEEFFVSPNHTPLQCYPSHGWVVQDQKSIEIRLSDGTLFKPTQVTFEKAGAKAMVIFWFQFGDFVVVNGEDQRLALEHYRPDREWPSMFKVMLHMPISSNYQDTDSLKDLAARIYEYTRTLQEGQAPKTSS